MFFQTQTGGEAEKNLDNYLKLTDLLDSSNQKAKELLKTFTSIGDLTKNTVGLLQELGQEAEQLNKQFLGTRARIGEFATAINEAVPGVVRLGGKYEDVRKTIAEIAEGSKRQIVATSKDVQELFAAGQVLGKNVKDIVDSFGQVGFSYDKISKNLATSVNYVQNIGLNARVVMGEVLKNSEALSRFNFENGVQGFTKMAAQASMLRIDMAKTLDFADKVLDPDRAVEVAASFQRLGVSVGNLTDPFQLMNQSINDPSGLQDSLTNALKSFTYFDEKSKSFKVSPDGILKMRELQETTGLSANELRRTALAAAELDSKLLAINKTGFNLSASEDDKLLVANIARMGEGGKYEVAIKDETGQEQFIELGKLTSEQFSKLVEQQKQAPQTIEEIQKKQLNAAETLVAEFASFAETMKSALLSLPNISQNIQKSFDVVRQVAGAPNQALTEKFFKPFVEDTKKTIEAINKSNLDEKEKSEKISQAVKELGLTFAKQGISLTQKTGEIMDRTLEKTGGFSADMILAIKEYFKLGTSENKTIKGGIGKELGTRGGIDAAGILGSVPVSGAMASVGNRTTVLSPSKQEIDVAFTNPNLNININVTVPPGLNQTALTDILIQATNPLKETIYQTVKQVAISKGEIKSATA